MDLNLSPENQQYLERIIAVGLYPSQQAALDAAIAALREKAEQIPYVPAEHSDAVERAMDESDAGLSSPMTDEDWSRLRQRAEDVASGRRGGAF